jgi:predicted Kef-type K+ transport protein
VLVTVGIKTVSPSNVMSQNIDNPKAWASVSVAYCLKYNLVRLRGWGVIECQVVNTMTSIAATVVL